MLKISLIYFLVFNLPAMGGESGRAGNGGGGLFCKGKKNYLLDYYEAEFNEIHTFNNLIGTTPDQRLNLLHSRISKYNPFLTMMIKHVRELFRTQSIYIKDVNFKIPEDYRTIFYERTCELKVVAVQISPFFEGGNIFFINQDLWEQLDVIAQEGLINHEILYYIALGAGAENSRSVRQALAYIMSDQFRDNEEEFITKFLNKVTNGGFF